MISYSRITEHMITYGQMNLIFSARNLWRDLAMWHRAYLVNRVAGIGTTEDVFKRLYRLPIEFGNTFRLIFGDAAAEKYTHLLSNAIIIFRDFIEAQVTGNVDLASQKVRELYQNGDERAAFFAAINPFWDEVIWRNLIYDYYNNSIEEVVSFLTGDAKNIDIFDRLMHHADSMGDYFSQGVFNYLSYHHPG